MQGYVTFALELTNGGVTNQRTEPLPVPPVLDGFTWQITCDDGAVTIHAMHEARYREIGRAAINDAGVMFARRGLADVPNEHQWKLVVQAFSYVWSMPVRCEGEARTDLPVQRGKRVEKAPRPAWLKPFVTFELGLSDGAVTNVHTEPTPSTIDDAFTWQVSSADGVVTIRALHAGAVTEIGRAELSNGGELVSRVGVAAEFPNSYQWGLVADGLAKVMKEAITVDGRARGGLKRRGRLDVGWRLYLAIALFVGGFGTLLLLTLNKTFTTGFPLHSWHVVVAPLAGLLAPLMVAGGIAILSSKEALSEPTVTGNDGKRTTGPLASMGIGLLTFGLLIYLYPLIMILDGTVGQPPRSRELPAASPPTPVIATRPVTPTPPAPPTPPQPPPPPPLEVQVATAPSLAAAIALAKPALGDGADHPGAWLLARYASAKLVWNDAHLDEPETSFGLVLKDADRERGKRMCATGKLLAIERKDLDQRPVYAGELETTEGDRARFIAVGSTGMLVKRSTGTLCGIVTGRQGEAVVLVGLFDLPENQHPAVER